MDSFIAVIWLKVDLVFTIWFTTTLDTAQSSLIERAFAVAGPSSWNRLPEDVRRLRCFPSFARDFKNICLASHIFQQCKAP